MLLNNRGLWYRTAPCGDGDVVGTFYADDSDTEDDSVTEDDSDTESENDETGLIIDISSKDEQSSSDNKRKLKPIIDCSSEDESDYEEDLELSKKLEQLAGEMLNDRQIV